MKERRLYRLNLIVIGGHFNLRSGPPQTSTNALSLEEYSYGDIEIVTKRQRFFKSLLRNVWNNFHYLEQLREHHPSKERNGPNITVGDLVCVHENKLNRLEWTIAKLERLLFGKVGAAVRKSRGQYKSCFVLNCRQRRN